MSDNSGRSGVQDFERERAELQAVLESEIFRRAPLLHSFLSYVCEKYFRGEAEEIKEYSIAVYGLGRPAGFNHTTDSIVRVEAHRLRKRLREYYEERGAGHPIRITIPAGAYVPVFEPAPQADEPAAADPRNVAVDRTGLPGPQALALLGRAMPVGGALAVAASRRFKATIALGAALTALLLVAVYLTASDSEAESSLALGVDTSLAGGFELSEPASELDAVVRISAGLNQTTYYVDGFGRPWQADRYFTGGTTGEITGRFIARCNNPTVYQTYREGDFRYDIPLQPGAYELRLHFAETTFGPGNPKGGAESKRQFNVLCNGKPLLNRFDILADASGPNIADVKVFRDISPAADGLLHLEFQSVNEKALLNGLEILASVPGRSLPIRIMAGRSSYYHDALGREWAADQYFDRGESVLRRTVVKGTSNPNLYGGERYGNFTYALPVAEGHYRLTLLFAETWFGPSNPGGNGPGSRVFDVYCNGEKLLKNFDLFKEAGGENIAVPKVFRNLTPNAQGKIVLSFVPVANYAMVNAIELVSETAEDPRTLANR